MAPTACSTDKPPTTPKISQAAPKSSAAPLPPEPATPSAAPTSSTPAPAISEAEGISTSQNYFDQSKKARSAHDIKALENIESGALLEISKGRQERILKYGDSVADDEDLAANNDFHVAPPQASPPGSDRWILSIGRQTIGKQSRESLGVSRQLGGIGPWRMTFLAFSDVGKEFPSAAEIATIDGKNVLASTNIDYGVEICRDFASYLDGGSTKNAWGPKAKSVVQDDKNNKHDSEVLTKGGTASFKTEVRDIDKIPSWRTTDGGRLVMCTTRTTSSLTAGPASSITITQSRSFQNFNGKITTWKTLNVVNVGMVVIKVPPVKGTPIEIVAASARPLSADGIPS
ncbi:hypothetical protein [Streptomyces sp. SID3343]|uniref:hypothetical protein n=1 Tax=Streptomyces sp. SID3343 TaxID=2690260 RepID=UPI0013717DDA|nr:hypothetical protein [Streptomyces sp. SID3343]